MTVQFNVRTGSRGIEWCDRTENPVGGCQYECRWEMPDGNVAICYAEDTAENGVAAAVYPHGFAHHYWRGERGLKNLISGRKPDLIFPDSMSDMFGPWVEDEQVITVLQWMAKAPHHTYQALSKSAGRLSKFVEHFPKNLWVGHSSPPDFMKGKRLSHDTQVRVLSNVLDVLERVRAETRCLTWMSLEPVSWDMSGVIGHDHPLDWAVIGAASNGRKYYQPDPEHVARLLGIFDATGTPVFFKGNMKPLFQEHPSLGRWREDFPVLYRDGSPIPAVLRRQDMAREHGWTLNTFLETGMSLAEANEPSVGQQMTFFG